MFNDGTSLVLTNLASAGNLAGVSGRGIANHDSSPALTNCILWGNSPERVLSRVDTPVFTYSDIQGGCEADLLNVCGPGNIDEEPLFVDPSIGDFHLHACSPCIDAGENTAPDLPLYDFEGDGRIVDGDGDGEPVVDMGVDEVAVVRPYLRLCLPAVLKGY